MGGPGEAVEMRTALLRLRRATGLPVAFGGLLEAGGPLRIAELTGAATGALRGLAIRSGNGLGGRSMALSRPCAVADYPAARHISHEYDAAVAAEGLRSVVAVPVVVGRTVRGVLYGALRQPLALGERVLDAAVAAARDVEQALAVRDGAEAVIAAARAPSGGGPGAWETVRAAHGDLRALAARIADPQVREEVLEVCARLAGAGGGRAAGPGAALAPRELDVLSCVAGGATNAAAADRLGLRQETVKSYLRSAMRKLGVRTRLEAVTAARRAGLLP
ncbi:helix-turn-helix transcriptional regulator [Streptomyces sp. t39]|uniref:helix-turn-helix transcriptional regulator n=1 Tax=Streptomyces sp. t39 TaxID=1828156 RepID=UPI0021C5D99C|nr:helix-turn-helix transcriptional regulator [Streptomyces sp. t39]